MKTRRADELLKMVDSELISNFEVRHPMETSLVETNEIVKRKPEDDKAVTLFIKRMMLAVAILVFFVFPTIWVLNKSFGIALFVCVLVLIIMTFFLILVIHTGRNNDERFKRHSVVLDEFEKAIDKLNPLHIPVAKYTRESIKRDILTPLAVMILDTEERFDGFCKKGGIDRSVIVETGIHLETYDRQLTEALAVAEEDFLIHYPRSEIFDAARAYIIEAESVPSLGSF